MYIKKIYEYKIHNIDIWSINQLCTQRFPWPLFSRVLWILQKRWWTWFLSTTSNRSIQDFTNFSNGQGILTVPRVTMDVNTWKVEHLVCQKKPWKGKAWQLFLIDVSKMHITRYITWSYSLEIATVMRDPLSFWILVSQGRFFICRRLEDIYIYTYI